MALIDVSELMYDPDFVDPYVVVRTAQSVDMSGRVSESSTILQTVGCVQPANNMTNQMFPECARVAGAIEIYTTFMLSGPTEEISADDVCWKGKTYTVVGVMPYGNYGNGYSLALCNYKGFTSPEVIGIENYAYMRGG